METKTYVVACAGAQHDFIADKTFIIQRVYCVNSTSHADAKLIGQARFLREFSSPDLEVVLSSYRLPVLIDNVREEIDEQ